MEYDEHLIKFHGTLLSLSKRGLLNKPPDGSETEEEIKKYEIEELSNFISTLPSFAKCKIAYYIILNTELRVSEDLRNDEFIGLFVNVTPAIPLQALIRWIDVLNLFNEFCKVVENSPCFLGEELVSAVLENQRLVSNPQFYFMLWCSIFKKICKIEKKNCLESPVKLMHYFKVFSQKVEKYLDLSVATYKNLCALEEFLMTVLCLVSYYKNPDLCDALYKLNISSKMTCNDDVLNETCIHFMLETVCNILNKLEFDKWNNSLSYLEEWKTIRSLSDRLLNEIKLLEMPADNLKILSRLAVKESELAIRSLVLDAKCGRKYDWARSIINSKVNKCSECPLHKLDDEDLDVLLHQAFEHLESSGEEMKELFLAALTLSHNQYKWLEIFFDKYKPNLLTTSNTAKDLIEVFNKMSTTENIPINIIIPLCMQSPVETIIKLSQLVMSSRTADLRVFHTLKPACQLVLPSGVTLLNHVIMCLLSEELTSAEEISFRHFVVKLKKENLLDSTFLTNLIKTLQKFLKNEQIKKAVVCLTLMDSVLSETEFVDKVALLVFISKILRHFSWDLATFSTTRANGRDAIYSIVGQLMSQLDYRVESEILNQAREEILKCWDVNQACFCDLWFKFGKSWSGSGKFDSYILALIHSSSSRSDLRQFLLTFGPPDEVRVSIVLALTKILPVLTLNVWCKILTELTGLWAEMIPSGDRSTSYEVFQMFLSAWYLLTLQLNNDNNIQSCYQHCMAGFGRLFSFASLEEESLIRIYQKILSIMKLIEDEEIRKSGYVTLVPLLKGRLESASNEETKSHAYKIEKILNEELKIK